MTFTNQSKTNNKQHSLQCFNHSSSFVNCWHLFFYTSAMVFTYFKEAAHKKFNFLAFYTNKFPVILCNKRLVINLKNYTYNIYLAVIFIKVITIVSVHIIRIPRPQNVWEPRPSGNSEDFIYKIYFNHIII